MPAKSEKFSLAEVGDLFNEGFSKAITRPTISGYKPHEKQVKFHTAAERGRLYIGGNRSGKTVGGVVEDIWWLTGKHPYLQTPEPGIRGRIVTVSYIEGIQKIIIPEITKWLPPSSLINGSWEDSYSKSERTLTLSNGSSVELMSYDQKLEKFAGTSRHFIHFDEEPPKDIFTECKMRLVDTHGSWWITMTPVEGMTWTYDDVYIPGLSPGGNIAVITIDSEENPFISSAELEIALEGLDSNELKARKEGKFVSIGGRALKAFIAEDYPRGHLIPALTEGQLQEIAGWTHYTTIDHGLNNPTCWLWHAASPNGHVITYDEIYLNETLIKTFAQMIKEREAQPFRQIASVRIGDPAIAQRNGETGNSVQTAYMMEEIAIMLGNNDVKIGLEKMNSYLVPFKWLITEDCPNLIRELPRLRWKTYETAKKRQANNNRDELHKKDDHAPDSARYLFSFLPELYVPPDGSLSKKADIRSILGAVTTPVGPDYFDVSMMRPSQEMPDGWTSLDEHMGGIW